ncbi:putative DUF21 domain-containing protein At3g13070, chloroplastic [Prosopis cineraria]|uniref:putative DUF21 domain-containing protein At3g13070, chloroplastic n=1 Tax=Prosopis cineraria TaxID=364024 RepID=UPI00240F160D|nr:putative DUF21 domain-containing protein At3g13070, chloroplastic [Prosopis cineraria]
MLAQLSILQDHQCETVSGSACEAFGYIPKSGESTKVVFERENDESDTDHQYLKRKYRSFKLEILEANARKVIAVRFEHGNSDEELFGTTASVPKSMKRKRKILMHPQREHGNVGNSIDVENIDGDASTKRPQNALSSGRY